jgi:hypothetical protein
MHRRQAMSPGRQAATNTGSGRSGREKWCAGCCGEGAGYRPATVRVEVARVLVEYRVVVKEPKSRNGRRTLPLDVDTAVALRSLFLDQAREKLAAGDA